MLKNLIALMAGVGVASTLSAAEPLTAKWEDLTSADFVKAVQRADGVCLLPMGSIEKFGPSAPLGTNVYLARVIPLEAVKQEYVIIYPEYFVAQTADTSTLPGTIHYSLLLQQQMLAETVEEMARNGCRKIILSNGHSGNTGEINLFMGELTLKKHDYAVYSTYPSGFPVVGNMVSQLPPAAKPSKLGVDGHGGEERVAAMMAYYPGLIHLDRAHDEPTSIGHGLEGQPGQNVNPRPAGAMTELPSGYSGDASGATAARGHALIDFAVANLVKFIRAVKADDTTLKVQKEFYEHVEHPRNPTPSK